MKVLLGTRNPQKLEELADILGGIPGVKWISAVDLGIPDPPEEGATLEENALSKAAYYAKTSGLPAISEDTGLEVEALGGAPGVHSSRFAGEEKDYGANNQKLLQILLGEEDRSARFRTVAVLALPDGRFWTSEGILLGHIAHEPRGGGGFGYDPLFIPCGEARTLAEMSASEKNAISHRRKAIEGLRPILQDLAQGRLTPYDTGRRGGSGGESFSVKF